MSLYGLLKQRESQDNPIKVGVIGAGTFSSAFINQIKITPGMRLVSVADLEIERVLRYLFLTVFDCQNWCRNY